MPKYELMYILSSAVSDNDVPTVTTEVDNFIASVNGSILSTQLLGKKKLAYPVKKTRNGFYILSTFQMEGEKIKELDNKLRSIDSIIRYLIVNLEEMDRRKAKDATVQEKMRAGRKPEMAAAPKEEIKITDTELEKKIEQALGSGDLTK